jgi:hypothetical protein
MENLIFDISTPDSAFKFIQDFFQISGSEFIHKYIIESKSNFDMLWERNFNYIEAIDITDLKYKVLHVTSNWDDCSEIKTKGLYNLQRVLSEQTTLSKLLSEHGVQFDIKNKVLYYYGKEFDIDYDKYRGKYGLTQKEEYLEEVARKIYFDPQINGFFAVDNVYGYGTNIHRRPEFLMNLVNLFPHLKEVEKLWCEKSKGYIVSFIADFNQFAWFSFYDNEDEYYEDKDSRLKLKEWIISKAVRRSFDHGNTGTEIYAYMKIDTIIQPDQIVEYQELNENNIIEYYK